MKIKFWGVRGSLPATYSLEQNKEHIKNVLSLFLKSGVKTESEIQNFIDATPVTRLCGFGQNTSCVQVRDGQSHIIIDGGTGIKVYGEHLFKHHPERNQHHILMTHFHMDHIMGLPFFPQNYVEGQEIHYYAVQNDCEKMIRSLFARPLFPLNYENLSAKIQFHQIKPYEKIIINGFDVIPYRTDHPDACYGYRIEKNGKVYSHAVDNEIERTSEAELEKDAGLFKNADLLYIDTQYAEVDMMQKKGWGHGTFDRAFEICSIFNIKQVLFAHHDPAFGASDTQKMVDECGKYFEENAKSKNIEKLKWSFAYDGETVEIK